MSDQKIETTSVAKLDLNTSHLGAEIAVYTIRRFPNLQERYNMCNRYTDQCFGVNIIYYRGFKVFYFLLLKYQKHLSTSKTITTESESIGNNCSM